MPSILKALCAAILAILEWFGGPSSTAPDAPDGAVPLLSGNETTAGVYMLLRTIDPCAMHDVAAAAVITGDNPEQILPDGSLATCQLRLHRGGKPTWTFVVEVGMAYPAARRQASTSEEIDGRRLYREEDTGLHPRSCTYIRPMGADHGISLTTVAPSGDAARPCPMAKAYLMAARIPSRLVLRAEKRTQPRLALASVDPCAAATPVLERLGVPGTAYPQAMYECRIQPQPLAAPASPPVTVSFGLGTDPTELAGADAAHAPVTVEGHRGLVATASDAQQCVVTIAYDPDSAAIQIDRTRWVQTISVHTSCDHAKPMADVVVHAVTTR